MAVDPVQASLNGRFTYRPDRGESWRILTGEDPVEGDCEDYALTLIWLYEARSMLRFWWGLITLKYVLWHCTGPGGGGHVVVWCRGRGWTDNIQRKMVPNLPPTYRRRFPYILPTLLLKFGLRPLLSRR
ncbi:hypothetical protein FHS89_001770 [Rubricella aquisinus]|uniref:Transglutaminase-like domain-containing protein n=1 Tax=Rubricella aquisinus TaxID=2028108 RepID=A0A840WX44_9RHOB|nr:hypothetical protein [Rubricella aquisinus]MBB5515750.1 hypothetical protein [Rubricella aquisinus]